MATFYFLEQQTVIASVISSIECENQTTIVHEYRIIAEYHLDKQLASFRVNGAKSKNPISSYDPPQHHGL